MRMLDIFFVAFGLALVSIAHGRMDEVFCMNHQEECLTQVPDLLSKTFANKHIVMVGDSLTRYQYLSLVYTLQYQKLLSKAMMPNLVEENSWSNWPAFYEGTTSLLAPNEVCDCARPSTGYKYGYENRYYHDPKFNISVSYFFYISDFLQGRINPNEQSNKELTDRLPSRAEEPYHPEWHYLQEELDKFFNEQVATLRPKPDAVVLNYGKWEVALSNEVIARTVETVFNFTDVFVWKTTTSSGQVSEHDISYQRAQNTQWAAHDKVTVMDLTTWTASVGSEYRWDNFHIDNIASEVTPATSPP